MILKVTRRGTRALPPYAAVLVGVNY